MQTVTQFASRQTNAGMQGRFHVKTKFEGSREDEAESLQADLAPITSDTLRCAHT